MRQGRENPSWVLCNLERIEIWEETIPDKRFRSEPEEDNYAACCFTFTSVKWEELRSESNAQGPGVF